MTCANPIDAALLSDYWLGSLAGDEEENVEEHLLGCDSCGARLQEMMALVEAVRQVAREGSLRMVVSEEFTRRAAAEGLRVREYTVPRNGSVACTVSEEDNLLIGRLSVPNLSGAQRVDLCICDPNGVEMLRLPDIPFGTGTGNVVYQESMSYAKAAPTSTMIARLVAVDEAGGETVAGEYRFNHTRTLPGPGA